MHAPVTTNCVGTVVPLQLTYMYHWKEGTGNRLGHSLGQTFFPHNEPGHEASWDYPPANTGLEDFFRPHSLPYLDIREKADYVKQSSAISSQKCKLKEVVQLTQHSSQVVCPSLSPRLSFHKFRAPETTHHGLMFGPIATYFT